MKLQQQRNVDEVIGVQQQHKFKITDGSQAIIMDSLINLYSDPIGSIVREITSNCIDANRERNLKLEGKIPMEAEDDKSFWSDRETICIEYVEKNTILGIDECIMFHDYGCGLSQERVQNVFTTFGASTKRDNNYEIGGFGLGAKSPLAYADTFYVSSRFNGTETYYMIYRNNDNVPHMDQVYQRATDERNGSTVIVPIKERYDADDFRQAISDQLCFFENIIFKNVVEGLGNVKNYYTGDPANYSCLEETDDYAILSDNSGPQLLVGRVRYPINWSMLKDIDNYDFAGSVAYKFDIGILDLVPSREEIRYTANTVKLIQEKLIEVKEQFKKDLAEKYAGITDYVEYLLAISNIKTSTSRYGYRSSSVDSSSCPSAVKSAVCDLTAFDVPFSKTPEILYKGVSPSKNAPSLFHQVFDGISVFICTETHNSNAIGGRTIYHKEINDWYTFFENMKKVEHIYKVDGNFSSLKSYAIINDREEGSFIAIKVDQSKIGAKIEKDNKLIDGRSQSDKLSMFNKVSNLIKQSKCILDYQEVEEPEDLGDQFGTVVDNKTRRKVNKQVFARAARVRTGYDLHVKYKNEEHRISDLQDLIERDAVTAVVYAETKDVEHLEKAVKVLSSYKYNCESWYGGDEYELNKKYRAFKVSKDVAKQFKDLEGFITAEDFMKTPKHIQKFATARRIEKYLQDIKFLIDFESYDFTYYRLFKDLQKYEDENSFIWSSSELHAIMEEITELGLPEDVIYDMEVINKLEQCVEYCLGLGLLNCVVFGSHSRKYVEDFLSLKDKMPDNQQVKLTLTAKNQTANELLSC